MDDQTPRPPTNVRVVDRVTTIETPVDTVFDHTDDDGCAMFRIVNLPEWFDPNRHSIDVDEAQPNTGLIAPLPSAQMTKGMRQVQDLFEDMSRGYYYAGLSAYLTRASTLAFLVWMACVFMWLRADAERILNISAYSLVGVFALTHARVMEAMPKIARKVTRRGKADRTS
jgi:hypothetical protein